MIYQVLNNYLKLEKISFAILLIKFSNSIGTPIGNKILSDKLI